MRNEWWKENAACKPSQQPTYIDKLESIKIAFKHERFRRRMSPKVPDVGDIWIIVGKVEEGSKNFFNREKVEFGILQEF